MDIFFSLEKEAAEKKKWKDSIRDYFYGTGALCAAGVITMNGGYYVPESKVKKS